MSHVLKGGIANEANRNRSYHNDQRTQKGARTQADT